MPGKYSHSNVLAHYSSQGLLSLPNDHVIFTSSVHSSRQVSRSRASSNSRDSLYPHSGYHFGRPYASSDALSSKGSPPSTQTTGSDALQRQVFVNSDTEHLPHGDGSHDAVQQRRTSEATTSYFPAAPRTDPPPPRKEEYSLDALPEPRKTTPSKIALQIRHNQHDLSNHGLSGYERRNSVQRLAYTDTAWASDPLMGGFHQVSMGEQDHFEVPYDDDTSNTSISSLRQSQAIDSQQNGTSVHHSQHTRDSQDDTVPVPPPMGLGHNRDDSSRPAPQPRAMTSGSNDTSSTSETQIYDPLPDTADFDGFSDSSEPLFIQKLNINGRGATSSPRQYLDEIDSAAAMRAVPRTSSSRTKQASGIRSNHPTTNMASRASYGVDASPATSRPNDYGSYESLSGTGDDRPWGVPSLVQASRVKNPITRKGIISPRESAAPSFDTTGRSPSPTFSPAVFEDGFGPTPDYASNLGGSRNSLALRLGMSVSELRSTLRATGDQPDDFGEVEACPPDIAKYKTGNGTDSQLTQYEAATDMEDGSTLEERMRLAQKRSNKLNASRNGMEDSDIYSASKSRERGFLNRLKTKSLSRKK